MVDSGRPCPACATSVPPGALTCPACGAISRPSAGNGDEEGIAPRLVRSLGQRYRIERELGRGGMAVVFLAHDLRHGRRVAIKVLLPEPSRILGIDRFRREIRIAAQLNHPHILPLHDSGEADGLLFYVMPYVEADSLRRRLTRGGPLPVGDAVRIAAEVADGLEYAHRLGVVHRDIKPENILLTESHAVIADFGIARPAEREAGTITTTGVSLGTPDYMSPEQAAADPGLDHRTDIYALGCTLYEMLTGKSPFAGPTPFAQARQHLADQVPSARTLRPEVPAALDAVVQRAMAKVPADRFASAAEFGEALGGFVATTGRGVPLVRPAVVRHWRGLAAGVAVLAGLGAVLLSHRRGPSQPVVRPPLRVVVRPFEDRTGRLAAVADSLTARLTGLLLPVRPALAVAPHDSVAEVRTTSLDTLRARFRAERFVSGRLEPDGDSLKVQVAVVNAATGVPIADTTYAVAQSAAVVDALAASLNGWVRLAFAQDLENQARRAMVRSDRVWALVEQAESKMVYASSAMLYGATDEGFRAFDQADSLLQDARRLDPRSDLITLDMARHANIGSFYSVYLAQKSGSPERPPDRDAGRLRALADLDALIRAKPLLAEARELRGSIKEWLYRDQHKEAMLDGALADYQAATDLDPGRASAWQARGSAYALKGSFTEALFMVETAIQRDIFQARQPYLLRNQFDYALRAERYELADSACRRGAAEPLPPDLGYLFNDCAIELWSRDATRERARTARARAAADSLAQRRDVDPFLRARREMWVAEIFAQAGLGERAQQIARPVMTDVPEPWQPFLLTEAAYLRFLLDDPDSALAIIATAVRRDPGMTRNILRFAPWFGSLRRNPRFIALVSEGSAPD